VPSAVTCPFTKFDLPERCMSSLSLSFHSVFVVDFNSPRLLLIWSSLVLWGFVHNYFLDVETPIKKPSRLGEGRYWSARSSRALCRMSPIRQAFRMIAQHFCPVWRDRHSDRRDRPRPARQSPLPPFSTLAGGRPARAPWPDKQKPRDLVRSILTHFRI